MRRKLFCSAVMASALGISTAWADDDAKESKKDVTVTTVVVNKGDDPVVVKGHQVVNGEKIVVGKYWLGVGLKKIEGDLAEFLGTEDGVLIEEVHEGSPADKAGVKKGDVILSVDSNSLKGVEDLLSIMRDAKADKALTLKLRRRKEELEIKVTPEPRPVELAVGIDLEEAMKGEHGLQFQVDPEKMQILRFGSPAGVIANSGHGLKGDLKLHVVNKQHGKSLELKIDREGDKPAVITVIKDGEAKTYNESQIDELPEEIRATVQSMLHPGEQSLIGIHGLSVPTVNLERLDNLKHFNDLRLHFEKASKDGHFEEAQKAFEKAMAEMKVSADHAKAAAEAFNNPEFRKQLDEIRAEAMAKLGNATAKAAEESKRAMAKAKSKAAEAISAEIEARAKAERAEVEELRKMVDQLKKEIADLKAAKDAK